MKVSLQWLQKYFDAPLPKAKEIVEALTFHAFEIEAQVGDMLDVKVLPNRAADCLSHRGIARELSAILDLPAKSDPLRTPLPAFPSTTELAVEIEDPKRCSRYMGALVKGVKVGPSPMWLKEALEAVGQRSINNIVDATNYVMLNVGQPLHAFDAEKMAGKEGRYAIGVRSAAKGEKITTLTGEGYELPEGALLITDAQRNTPIGIAGVKGGKTAEVSNATTDLIIEAANFDGTTVRKTAQTLALFTDASARFQNRPSPELVAYGMCDVLALIKEIAGGEIIGVVDEYPTPAPRRSPVAISLARINGLLGSKFTIEDVTTVFKRLGLSVIVAGDTFTVTPHFERSDLSIPEDLVEEVGRIMGYETIPATELPPFTGAVNQDRFRGIERMKDELVARGYIEVSTQTFAKKGAIVLANPLDTHKPALRTSLKENLADALTRAREYAPLVLSPGQRPKLFEVGSVFPEEGEHLELRMTEPVPEWGETRISDNLSKAELEEYGKGYEPKHHTLGAYIPFSIYPFITRDIALWVSKGTRVADIESVIREHAGELLVRLEQFDHFEKEGRESLAFRLVFQSMERTLTDEEANAAMEGVSEALIKAGFEVR